MKDIRDLREFKRWVKKTYNVEKKRKEKKTKDRMKGKVLVDNRNVR